jgi:hypothetical protein
VTATAATRCASADRTVTKPTTGGAAALRPVRSNQAALRYLAAVALPVQPKLQVGAVNDPLELEADRVAEHVMRMPEPAAPAERGTPDHAGALRRQIGTIAIQRAAEDDEVREKLVHAYLNDQATVQRQAEEQPHAEDDAEGEKILMQSKAAGPERAPAGADLETGVRSLEGRGEPLSASVRSYMEPRFGHDFGAVRVHADGGAAEMARRANARAFTVGRNVVFARGEYASDSVASRSLLAHELTHVIQQGRAGPALQRKIVVAGKPYTPSADYYTYLVLHFGAAMKEFVERMHNAGNPPDYAFSSYWQLGNEVQVRASAIKGIEEIHKGCCSYSDSAHPPYVDSTYWDKGAGFWDFKLKSPLPAGKKPSDAIDAIFAPGAGTRLECYTMTLAVEYYSMLKGLGADAFNAKFPAGIQISQTSSPLITGADKQYEWLTLANRTDMLPGDWGYIKNFPDYLTRVPSGYWQGENVIYLGGGMFRGFGVAALSEHDLMQELVNRYNNDGAPVLAKTVADLYAAGGGLLKLILRPIRSKLPP